MLLGSKEGVAHLLWGTCDSGDVVGVCDPNYPVYPNQTRLAGASVVTIPLEEQNRFLPSLNWLTTMAPRLKLLCLNFPNNPTAAVAGLDFYSKVVELALRCGFYVVNDNVYSELYFGKHRPPSILEVPDAKTCSLEFHSLSKTFSMAGWRIGMAVGSRKLIQALLRMKQNTDSGPFGAIQDAAAFALAGATRLSAVARRTYQRRRDVFCRELTEAGWRVPVPEATFYVWAQVPQKASSDLETEGPRQAKSDVSSDRTAAEGGWRRAKSDVEFVKEMLRECRVMAAPGSGFGQYGRGYVRFALVADEKKLREAASRIGKWLRKRTV
jgi:aspartate/methionine/tyrosine aminotransferase